MPSGHWRPEEVFSKKNSLLLSTEHINQNATRTISQRDKSQKQLKRLCIKNRGASREFHISLSLLPDRIWERRAVSRKLRAAFQIERVCPKDAYRAKDGTGAPMVGGAFPSFPHLGRDMSKETCPRRRFTRKRGSPLIGSVRMRA